MCWLQVFPKALSVKMTSNASEFKLRYLRQVSTKSMATQCISLIPLYLALQIGEKKGNSTGEVKIYTLSKEDRMCSKRAQNEILRIQRVKDD